MRERGSERKGGRWQPQQKIVKWVGMAEEREMLGERDRERKRAREEIKEVSMAAGREKREHERERERDSVHV